MTLECVDMSSGQKPEFTTQIQSLEGLKDGQSAHFECTLVPVGDPNLKVEWFVNGQPLRHSSRIKTVSDFGFVVLDIAYVQSHDSGEYICKASNKFGEDFTRATLRCFGKGGVYSDSLQPDSLAKIRALEEQSLDVPAPLAASAEAPKFITQLTDIARLVEGQSAHFEARLTPVNDPLLAVEWFFNGTKLPTGHRFRTFHDFGIVILDILYCYEEDCGVYECRAVNRMGTDTTKATLKCLSKASLILDSQLPKGMESLQKIQSLEDRERREGAVEEAVRQAPVFTVPLNNVAGLREGENAHFEGRLTPTDDPKLKVLVLYRKSWTMSWTNFFLGRMVLQRQTSKDGLSHPHILRLWLRHPGNIARLSGRFRRVFLPGHQRIRRGRHFGFAQMPRQTQRHFRVATAQGHGTDHRAHRRTGRTRRTAGGSSGRNGHWQTA